MTRITIPEFCYMLEYQDPDLLFVIVEGLRDIAFWHRILPCADRDNAEIWSIDSIDDPDSSGGKRGRLIRLAKNLENAGFANRVSVFADADFDRVLEVEQPVNVCLTDFRDLEGYAYNAKGCEHFAFVFNRQQLIFSDLDAGLEEPLKYLSSIRLTAPVDGDNLKVNNSVNTLKKSEYDFSCGSIKINKQIFLKRLLQNSGISLSELPRISNRVDTLGERFNIEGSKDHIHGKDLIKLLSIYFKCDAQEMQRHVWGALNYCVDDIRQMPAIAKTLAFLSV